jgi:hypothetical protein
MNSVPFSRNHGGGGGRGCSKLHCASRLSSAARRAAAGAWASTARALVATSTVNAVVPRGECRPAGDLAFRRRAAAASAAATAAAAAAASVAAADAAAAAAAAAAAGALAAARVSTIPANLWRRSRLAWCDLATPLLAPAREGTGRASSSLSSQVSHAFGVNDRAFVVNGFARARRGVGRMI